MRRERPAFVFLFATALAALLGLAVATAANGLAPRIAANAEFERRYNVLIAMGVDAPRGQANRVYDATVRELVVEVARQELPVFLAIGPDSAITGYCIPVEGPGLWGPIRGYLALDAGASRVLGVTFFDHRETPGLGADIASRRWTDKWRDKSIVSDSGEFVGIRVLSRPLDPSDPDDVAHAVDGISGATITSKSVERLVHQALVRYRPYLEQRWPND